MSKIAREIYGIANWGAECVVDSVIEACWELVNRHFINLLRVALIG